MKREEIKKIFPDANDEQLKAIMDLNGADVEKLKSKVTDLESEVSKKEEALNNLSTEFETLKSNNAGAEEYKTKFEQLEKEIKEKEAQAEAERLAKEKEEGINARFTAAVGDKKFSHAAIEADYRQKFGAAIESADYQGKSDVDIFHALTKDDATAFQGITAVKLSGGNVSNNLPDERTNTLMRAMGIKEKGE